MKMRQIDISSSVTFTKVDQMEGARTMWALNSPTPVRKNAKNGVRVKTPKSNISARVFDQEFLL
jgi:hypothetical protein